MITPLQYVQNENFDLGVNLYLKRDDYYPITGGGNKGRKATFIFNRILKDGCDAVVTCGGPQSNHTRVTAIRCKELGIDCTVVIHGKQNDAMCGNLKLLSMLGVRIIYCEMNEVSDVMDSEMTRFVSLGKNPFYIWGGGHCYEGVLAYFDAVKELRLQSDVVFDAVFHASGTGATQAGLHCGFKQYYDQTKVYGISVSRDKKRGTDEIEKSIEAFTKKNNLELSSKEDVMFDDDYNFGGYEKTNDDLNKMISNVAQRLGIILDSTYTGKAWFGMENYIKNKKVKPGANVLFWHTGGLLNLMNEVI